VIALADQLPCVVHEDGFAHAFDPDWLIDSIDRAAKTSGHSRWWSEQVADSILYYFKKESCITSVTTVEIRELVSKVLAKIGADEVAQSFSPLPPRFNLSLHAIAIQSGPGFELMFFNRLRERLKAISGRAFSCVNLYGLKSTVKFICGRKSWRRRCIEFEREILDAAHDILAEPLCNQPIQLVIH